MKRVRPVYLVARSIVLIYVISYVIQSRLCGTRKKLDSAIYEQQSAAIRSDIERNKLIISTGSIID